MDVSRAPAERLPFGEASFDAALSVFGVILFPDASLGIREIARILKPNGRAAIVTWTETERYELAARLIAAIATLLGVFALILSAAALYGLLAHMVGRRTGEIGIRLALGAPRHTIGC